MFKKNELIYLEKSIKRYVEKLFKLKSRYELAKEMLKMNDLVYFEKSIKRYVKFKLKSKY